MKVNIDIIKKVLKNGIYFRYNNEGSFIVGFSKEVSLFYFDKSFRFEIKLDSKVFYIKVEHFGNKWSDKESDLTLLNI